MLAEAVVMSVRQVLHVLDVGLGAEPGLGEGQVEADGIGRDLVSQGLELLGEPLGLLVADRGVELGDHVEEAGLAGRIGQRDHGEPGADACEFGCGVARFQLRADQVDGIALEGYFALAYFCHGCRSRWVIWSVPDPVRNQGFRLA